MTQRKCWRVNVVEDICPAKSLYVSADRADVTMSGDLIFWIDNYTPLQTLVIAHKKWLAFYEVSAKNKTPVNVDFEEIAEIKQVAITASVTDNATDDVDNIRIQAHNWFYDLGAEPKRK